MLSLPLVEAKRNHIFIRAPCRTQEGGGEVKYQVVQDALDLGNSSPIVPCSFLKISLQGKEPSEEVLALIDLLL